MRNNVHKEEWRDILVYLEYHHNKIHPIGYQLLGKAWELGQIQGTEIIGVVIGKNTCLCREQLKNYPLKRVFMYETEECFKSDLYDKIFEDCIRTVKPSVVLVGGTREGRSLSPRAATAFRTGLTADCTELFIREKSDLVQTRPAFGGNIMAQIVTRNTRPQFATVRYNVMKPAEPVFEKDTEYITVNLDEHISSRLETIEVSPIPKVRGIEQQDILVVAGKGIKKKEHLAMLEELAELLGGELASTRGLVEMGWMPAERQIGISGQTVRPKLMITCGVSGSVQFMAGMSSTENIIAINTDPEAKIFNIAHYPICGDLYEIVPILIDLLKTC